MEGGRRGHGAPAGAPSLGAGRRCPPTAGRVGWPSLLPGSSKHPRRVQTLCLPCWLSDGRAHFLLVPRRPLLSVPEASPGPSPRSRRPTLFLGADALPSPAPGPLSAGLVFTRSLPGGSRRQPLRGPRAGATLPRALGGPAESRASPAPAGTPGRSLPPVSSVTLPGACGRSCARPSGQRGSRQAACPRTVLAPDTHRGPPSATAPGWLSRRGPPRPARALAGSPRGGASRSAHLRHTRRTPVPHAPRMPVGSGV